jgi:hypothetical protein
MMRVTMACMASLLVLAAGIHEHRFSRLKAVEAYEIRPRILMTPIYSDTGELCRVILEKRHVSSNIVDVDAQMSAVEIYGIFDELAPKVERGKLTLNLEEGQRTLGDSPARSTIVAYENVSLEMHGKHFPGDIRSFFENGGYVAATINWEKRECRGGHSGE